MSSFEEQQRPLIPGRLWTIAFEFLLRDFPFQTLDLAVRSQVTLGSMMDPKTVAGSIVASDTQAGPSS